MTGSRMSLVFPAAVATLLAASWVGADENSSSTPEGERWSSEAYKSSRIYRADSEAVWKAVQESLGELKFKIDKEDEATGVLVTRRKSLRKLFPEKLVLADGYVGHHVTLYIMVPRFAEPGRVYLNSVTHAQHPVELTGSREVFNHDSIASRLFTDVDRRLGIEGAPIPDSFADRQALAREWAGGVGPGLCRSREVEPSPVMIPADGSLPERIPASHQLPEFGLSSKPGKVLIQALLSEDGVVEEILLRRSTEPAWQKAAMAAVMRWRYTPALRDGCPAPAWVTVIVDYSRSN